QLITKIRNQIHHYPGLDPRKELKVLRTPREEGVRIRRDRNGISLLTVAARDSELIEVYNSLDHSTGSKAVESFFALFFSAGGAQPARRVTNVIVPAPTFRRIMEHPEDADEIMLEMTNGAFISGKEWLETTEVAGYITIIDPVEGGINCYRTNRAANFKQLLMAKAESPTCAVDTCLKAADDSHVHHIQAWSQGGMTNQVNLTMLCPFHNGRNDDDRSKPLHGHIERVEGGFVWVYPGQTTEQAVAAQRAKQAAQQPA
ncbi:HNH endonuclease signature motif containing protein, partial [Corynebacterium sp.]|uniref:HNH endonuclease signature motif containing protein n=1 Tax=Corynebacterium sp. TaxID=1720 RepID=UPI0026DA8A23